LIIIKYRFSAQKLVKTRKIHQKLPRFFKISLKITSFFKKIPPPAFRNPCPPQAGFDVLFYLLSTITTFNAVFCEFTYCNFCKFMVSGVEPLLIIPAIILSAENGFSFAVPVE